MRQVVRAKPLAHGGRDEDEAFYGWRFVRRVHNDTEVIDPIPLTLEDLLYPEEGDFVVYEPAQGLSWALLTAILVQKSIGSPYGD